MKSCSDRPDCNKFTILIYFNKTYSRIMFYLIISIILSQSYLTFLCITNIFIIIRHYIFSFLFFVNKTFCFF